MSQDQPKSAMISNYGQAEAAAAKREGFLKERINNMSQALASYIKQHDAAYPNSKCTCVNCVWSRTLLGI